MQFWMSCPIFIQNQEKFLSSTQSKHWNETSSSTCDNIVYCGCESTLTVFAFFVNMSAIGRFDNKHIRFNGRQLRGHQVPVFFSGKISGIEDTNARNFDHEHGSSKNVASVVSPEFYSAHFFFLVKVESFYFVHADLQIMFCKKHLVRSNVGHFDEIG